MKILKKSPVQMWEKIFIVATRGSSTFLTIWLSNFTSLAKIHSVKFTHSCSKFYALEPHRPTRPLFRSNHNQVSGWQLMKLRFLTQANPVNPGSKSLLQGCYKWSSQLISPSSSHSQSLWAIQLPRDQFSVVSFDHSIAWSADQSLQLAPWSSR